MLRREAVVDLHDARAGLGGEPARDMVVAADAAHDPAAAMDEQQGRARSSGL